MWRCMSVFLARQLFTHIPQPVRPTGPGFEGVLGWRWQRDIIWAPLEPYWFDFALDSDGGDDALELA
jgi:hypothetical protein